MRKKNFILSLPAYCLKIVATVLLPFIILLFCPMITVAQNEPFFWTGITLFGTGSPDNEGLFFSTLKDTLHLNLFQFRTFNGSYLRNGTFLGNSSGLKVISEVDRITDAASKTLTELQQDTAYYNNRIRVEVETIKAYQNHLRFYPIDEPTPEEYASYKYVSDVIKTVFSASDSLRARSITTVDQTGENFQQFINVCQPRELLVNPYPFRNYIPHPSLVGQDSVADNVRIRRWESPFSYGYGLYFGFVQQAIDSTLVHSIRPAAKAADSLNLPLIFMPQLHGDLIKNTADGGHSVYDYDNSFESMPTRRPPSPTEIRVQYNLEIAYGAKGFLAYPYGFDYGNMDSWSETYPGIVSQHSSLLDHSSNKDIIWGKLVWTGYKEKWDEFASINKRLKEKIGDTLLALSWVGAKSWNMTTEGQGWYAKQDSVGAWEQIVKSCSAVTNFHYRDDLPQVEVGHLQRNNNTDYLAVVNRRTANNDTAIISLTLGNKYPFWKITDIENLNKFWYKLPNQVFSDTFRPGDGKIYRLDKTAPLTPLLHSPADNATQVSTMGPLRWNAATGAQTYNLQVSTSSNFSSFVVNETGLTGLIYDDLNLDYLTHYYWRVSATNTVGVSSWSTVRNFWTTSGGGGGCCPYIFTSDEEGFHEDNNLLPQSEYSSNRDRDVTDYYKLLRPLIGKNGLYTLEVREFEREKSQLDQFKLLAIDHPDNTDIAVLKTGEIVQYSTPFELTETDEMISPLKHLDQAGMRVKPGDAVNLKFQSTSDNLFGSAEIPKVGLLLGGWAGRGREFGISVPPCEEKPDKVGVIGNGTNKPEETDHPFTFRERQTLIYVPLDSLSEDVTVQFGKEVMFDYARLAVEVSKDYQEQELTLVRAVHTKRGDITSNLRAQDQDYAQLKPGETIELQYSAPPMPEGMERSFILISQGRYEQIKSLTNEVPEAYFLSQNYPNPFNPVTTIEYGLPEASHVSLKVYNLLGQEVKTLVDWMQDAGYKAVELDASTLPSGIYIYRLHAGNYGETRKLVFMK